MRNKFSKFAGLLSLLIALFLVPSPSALDAENRDSEETRGRMKDTTAVDSILREWPEMPRDAAIKLIRKYGKADEATASHLVWHNNGPWVATVVLRQEFKHDWPVSHVDFVQQFVRMKVPLDKVDDVIAYDGSVQIDRTAGLVSARCGGEPMNFLALNLAHEVANGKRSVDEARAFYAKTAKSKEDSPYTQKLLFPQDPNSADLDRPQEP